MAAAEHKTFPYILSFLHYIIQLVFLQAGGDTVYVSTKNFVNTEIFFNLFFQEKGGSVGGEPLPPPVVDYLTILCRRRLGQTSNHFV